MSDSTEDSRTDLDLGLRKAFGRRPKEPVAARGNEDREQPGFAGRYELGPELGRGGMGIVRRAHDTVLGREVALKLLRPEFSASADRCRRFVEEAKIASTLQHPGIVPVYDRGVTEEGELYFTMKLVTGETLKERLRATAHDSAARRNLLVALSMVADAMAAAHAVGVIHRDLKPSNIMLGAFGEVLVMDFGLAKLLADPLDPAGSGLSISVSATTDSAQTTRGDTVLGTPSYMAPEQAQGRRTQIGPPSDVFALGAILHEILLGEPPRRRNEDGEVALIALGQPERPIDPPLLALLRECLSADPKLRPAHAGVVAERLHAYLAGLAEAKAEAEREAAASRAKLAAERGARRKILALSAALVVAAIGLAAYWVRATQDALKERERQTGIVHQALQRAVAAGIAAEGDQSLASAKAAWTTAENAQLAADSSRVPSDLQAEASRLRAEAKARLLAAEVRATRKAKDDALFAGFAAMHADLLTKRTPAITLAALNRLLAEWGIDLERDSASEIVSFVSASTERERVVEALHRTWDLMVATKITGERDARWLLSVIHDLETTEASRRFVALRLERDEAGVAAWMRAEDLSPVPPLSLALTNRALSYAGMKDAAREIALRIVDVHPRSVEAQLGLAILFQNSEKPEEVARALRALEAAEVLLEDLPFARSLRVMLLARARAREEAHRILVSTRPDLRKHPMMLDAEGTLLMLQGSVDAALPVLEEAVAKDPGNHHAKERLALVHFRQGNLEMAESHLRRSLSTFESGSSRALLGQVLAAIGAVAEAEACFRRAIELGFGTPDAWVGLIRVLDQQTRYQGAAKVLDECRPQRTGSSDPRWKPLEELESALGPKLKRVEALLKAFVAQGDSPPTKLWPAFAAYCRDQQAYGRELDVYVAAFEDDPTLVDSMGFAATEVSIIVARGDPMGQREKIMQRALGWLSEALRMRESTPPGTMISARALAELRYWQRCESLALVREDDHQAKLPPEVATAWRDFWSRLDAVLSRSERR